ncbi:hypothetical protein E2C01_019019 [Portunus trituberculatus]|uniref:Uncharacterized protein n=1 Tax=Portunus trituberculatus TaxID=210409 RepID=A0A5B7DX58_PORTR|nr:hypothetical protein [Portunus trituberculatus]
MGVASNLTSVPLTLEAEVDRRLRGSRGHCDIRVFTVGLTQFSSASFIIPTTPYYVVQVAFTSETYQITSFHQLPSCLTQPISSYRLEASSPTHPYSHGASFTVSVRKEVLACIHHQRFPPLGFQRPLSFNTSTLLLVRYTAYDSARLRALHKIHGTEASITHPGEGTPANPELSNPERKTHLQNHRQSPPPPPPPSITTTTITTTPTTTTSTLPNHIVQSSELCLHRERCVVLCCVVSALVCGVHELRFVRRPFTSASYPAR